MEIWGDVARADMRKSLRGSDFLSLERRNVRYAKEVASRFWLGLAVIWIVLGIREKAVARSGWADDGLDVAKAMVGVDRIVVCAAAVVVLVLVVAIVDTIVIIDTDLYQTVFSEELGEIFLLGLGN